MSRLSPGAVALAVATLTAALPAAVDAQQQVVRPPVAQYWMDVATHSMAGMPEIPGLGALPFLGGGPGAGGGNVWGNTRGMSPGRWLDLALHVRTKPAGVEGTHAIPPGVKMGAGLPLMPVKPAAPLPRERAEQTEREYEEEVREKPSGRILIYWGCGETVRPGQPTVIDLANANPMEFGRALGGRHVPERGARVGPGYSLWPNETSRNTVPRDASLIGDHAVSGDGVPASFRFAVAQQQDFMPRIDLVASGPLSGSVALQWPANPQARGHYLHAMGSIGKDMVLWSSAEVPDSGMGLFDYLSNATIDRWIKDRLLLPGAETRCAIPKGIFAGGRESGGGMLRMISYGHELNLVHPPRPADPKIPWDQEWAARIRVKATTMAMLGQDMGGRQGRRGGLDRGETEAASGGAPVPAAPVGSTPVPVGGTPVPIGGTPVPVGATTGTATDQGSAPPQREENSSSLPIPGLPGAGRALDAIRGIFGR